MKLIKNNNTDTMTYTINNKAIINSQLIKIQSIADDVYIYGWSLEFRHKNGSWFTYWNHRIYNSISSALDAATKIYPSYSEDYEFRILPLYKMLEPEYRDYKINQLLNKKEPKLYEIKAWKVKEDCDIFYEKTKRTYKYKKGTLFIQMEDGNIRSIKDQISMTSYHDRFQLFNDLIKNEQVEEVNIQNEKWAHPHLCKELKNKIKK